MSNLKKLCTIVTGNSNSGSACIDFLFGKHASTLNVRAVFRSEEKSKPFKAKYPGLEIVCGVDAAKPETVNKAFVGACSAYIVTVHDPSRGFEFDAILTQTLIDAAVECGVKYIVLVTSFTQKDCERMPIISSRFRPLELHLKVLEEKKGLKWTILRGGCFMDNLVNSVDKVKNGSDVFNFPKVNVPFVSTTDIGYSGAACLAATNQSEHHGKTYQMCGPKHFTGEEIAALLGKLLGKEIKYNELTKEVYTKFLEPGVAQIMSYFGEFGKDAAPFTQDVKNLTGQNSTLEEFLKQKLC
jgi:NAD(P)H dehydrogenase (quinone)